MSKQFVEYLNESEREYHFRIKTIDELTDERMDAVENLLAKYDLLDISAPQKTIVQRNPLDFPDIDSAEVYMIDCVTRLPISAYILCKELRHALDINEKYIVVRGANDPLEMETQRINAEEDMRKEAEAKGLKVAAKMSTSPDYLDSELGEDGSNFYGDTHNAKFLDYLAKVAADRGEMRVDPPDPLFSWMQMPKDNTDDTDFNKDLKDNAPKPKYRWRANKNAKPPLDVPHSGNFDNDYDVSRIEKDYVTKTGKKIKVKASSKGIR